MISQLEFKVGLLMTLEGNQGKPPSSLKDLERFRALLKSGIPLAAISDFTKTSRRLDFHDAAASQSNELDRIDNSSAIAELKKELVIARMGM